MDGDATCVDGGDACRGKHNHALGQLLFEGAQKGGLAGSGFPGEKDVCAGVLHKLPGKVQFGVFHSCV